jgi:GTP-binding protein
MKLSSVEFYKSVAEINQLPKDGLPEIAFAGRSNVGKSSLINCLLNQKKIAKTSSTPGKTRLLNYFVINQKFYLVDLPGYGFAKVNLAEKIKWQNLIEQYIQQSQTLKGLSILTDLRHPLMQLDLEMIAWVASLRIPMLVIGTKADKLSANQLNNQLAHNQQQLQEVAPDLGILPFSSVTRLGRQQLWGLIDNLVREE